MHSSHLDPLLPEMKQNVFSHLPLADIGRIGRVSNSWYGFMSRTMDWMSLIARDFSIPVATLTRFNHYAQRLVPGLSISFKDIYRRLRFLSAQDKKMKKYPFYNSPDYHLPLLACCANRLEARSLLTNLIPSDEAHEWIIVSIRMHANESAKHLIDLFPHHLCTRTVNTAIYSVNTAMAIFLLERDQTLFEVNMIANAAGEGNAELLFYLLKRVPPLDAQERAWVAARALESGDVDLLSDLIEFFKEKNIKINLRDCHYNALTSAASSPNKKVLPYLVDLCPELVNQLDSFDLFSILHSTVDNIALIYRLNPTLFVGQEDHLAQVAGSAEIEAVRFVIDTFHIKPQAILAELALHAHIDHSEQLIKYLVEQYDLVPSQRIFDMAAGNERLFRYLLARFQFTPKKKALTYALTSGKNIKLFDELCERYSLTADDKTLTSVFYYGNVSIINYLMDKFGLQPNDEIFKSAQCFDVAVARVLLLKRLGDDLLIKESPPSWINSEALIYSHRQIFQGLESCKAEDFAAAEKFWLQAAKNSIRHFFAFVVRAVSDPHQYHLNEDQTIFLREVAQRTTSFAVTITEHEVIYSMLANSNDRELQQLAEAFSPKSNITGARCQI